MVLALLARLDRRDFHLGLAAPRALLEEMAAELRPLDVETADAAAESWLQPLEIAALASFIRRFHPDIVNSHLFRSTLVAAPLAKRLGVPRVVETYHGREAWRRGAIKGSFGVDRAVARWVDRVIAVSEAAREFLVRTKGIPAAKVVVVPNGRDLSIFKPGGDREAIRRELGLGPHTPVIGIIGRLEEQKGHVFALDGLSMVVSEFPEARLLVVGEGSLRGRLEAHARSARLAAHVLFTGFRRDVPRLIDAMDVVALPSLYEGMPLTAIEASAMAKPIVATAVDGTAEVVQDGTTGLLVPPGDPVALAEAIRVILRNSTRAKEMGEAGRRWVRARFDLDRQVEATARRYREVLVGHPASACA